MENDKGSLVEGVRPCPVGVVTGGIRACTQPEVCRRGRHRRRTVAKWGQYRLEGDQGSPVEGVRPCPVGVVTNSLKNAVQKFSLIKI